MNAPQDAHHGERMFCPRCHRSFAGKAPERCPHDGAELLGRPRIEAVRRASSPLDGEVIDDRYVIRGLLGRGGMSTVYLAEDLRTGEPWAVKILGAESADRASAQRDRFLREAMVARAIDHPSVVRIEGSGAPRRLALPRARVPPR
ncbi:MAG: hypothetical protein U0359_13595 [Byssovorax sp.]